MGWERNQQNKEMLWQGWSKWGDQQREVRSGKWQEQVVLGSTDHEKHLEVYSKGSWKALEDCAGVASSVVYFKRVTPAAMWEYTGISQRRWHLGWVLLCCGGFSVHCMTFSSILGLYLTELYHPRCSCGHQKYLQTLSNVSQGQKHPRLRNTRRHWRRLNTESRREGKRMFLCPLEAMAVMMVEVFGVSSFLSFSFLKFIFFSFSFSCFQLYWAMVDK